MFRSRMILGAAGVAALVGVTVAVAVNGSGGPSASRLPHVSYPVARALDEVDRTRVGPLTPLEPGRLQPAQERAILRLGRSATTARPANGDGHVHGATIDTVVLDPATEARLEKQLKAARGAAARLADVSDAIAAGYQVAAAPDTGVGTHFVKWSLVDRPFDPAEPSMVLFDYSRGGEPRLVGLSYWVRSDTEPEGFAGPNDVWHQHSGLCVVNGWVDRERAEPSPACQGTWLGGADLWMLHVWVVPGWENRKGVFANYNPALCPPFNSVPDIERCELFEGGL